MGARHLLARLPPGDPDGADRRPVLTARPLYHELAWAYDLLVVATGMEPEWVAAALGERGVGPGALVVDAGCGTGRHARELAARGYRVIGIDRSAELIEEASGGAAYEVADLLHWRPPEPADAVLCRGVLNDLLREDERARALRSLGAMLGPRGLLLGDVRDLERSAERYAEPRATERQASTARGEVRFESTMRFDGEELHADERIEAGGREYRGAMRMRPWTRDELASGLAEAGLAVEFLDPAAAGARDDRIVFSARARA